MSSSAMLGVSRPTVIKNMQMVFLFSAHHFTSVELGCVSVCTHAAVQNGERLSTPSGALHAAAGGKGDNSVDIQVDCTKASLHL